MEWVIAIAVALSLGLLLQALRSRSPRLFLHHRLP